MNVVNVIYAASELSRQDFNFSIMATQHLKCDFQCIATSESTQIPPQNLYQEASLMRLLTLKSDLLTQPLQEEIYGHSYEDKEFSFIIEWSANCYAYMLIKVSEQFDSDQKEQLLAKLPDISRLIKQNLRQGEKP